MKSFHLGPWAVHTELHEFVRGDERRRVGSKVMEVLCCLAEEPGRVVLKDDLVARVWQGDFASDEALSAVIYELRRTLDDDARRPRYVETIRKRGYRLVASVTPLTEPVSAEAPEGKIPAGLASFPGHEAGNSSPSLSVPIEEAPGTPPRSWRRGAAYAAASGVVLLSLFLFWPRPAPPPSTEPEAGGIRSLAVLPVSSYNAKGGGLDLAEALTQMLTADLAQSCPLEIASGLSVREDGGSWDLARVESELGVDAVVEASVLRSQDRYWISVQLVETGTGRLLWGASYDREGPDSLAVLREVALNVAEQVSGTLPPTLPPFLDSSQPNLR